MAFAWEDVSAPLNRADDRQDDRAADKRSPWPRYNRALATDGRTLTMERQQHLDATGALGPPVLDVEQARADYARAAKHAQHTHARAQAMNC